MGGVEHQLALGPTRRLECLEQAVEGAAETTQLVGAARGQPARHVGRLRHVLDAVGERIERDQRGPGHQPAQRDGEEDTGQSHDLQQQCQRPELGAGVEERGDLKGAPAVEDAGLDRRPRRQVLDELAHLVPVHGDRGEEVGGEADRHQADLTGHGETAPGDDGARVVDHLAHRRRGRPDFLARHHPLRRRGERVVGGLEQRVAGHQVSAEGGRQHGDHHGGRGRQDEPAAEGHVSRST